MIEWNRKEIQVIDITIRLNEKERHLLFLEFSKMGDNVPQILKDAPILKELYDIVNRNSLKS